MKPRYIPQGQEVAKSDEPMTEIVGHIYWARRGIDKHLPSCREASLALTKLDEAVMWLKSIPVEIDAENSDI